MNKDKAERLVTLLLGIVAGALILIVLMKEVVPVLLPFMIAWAVAFAVRGPARKISEKTHIPERALRVFIAIFTTLFLFGIVALIVWRLTAAVWSFLSGIGEENAVYDVLTKISEPGLSIFGDGIPDELAARISEAIEKMLSGALSALAESVTGWVGVIPKVLFFLLVTVISLIYFSLDLERINSFVKSLLPARFSGKLSDLRKKFFEVGAKYIRSYALILLITFGIMLLGFLVIGVKHAFVLAVFVSLLDILPVIGVGTVLLPWSIFEFAVGNHPLGVGLIILFVINLVVRQFSEPKIVGKNLNIHPVLTLFFLYVGYAFFGVWGLVTVPIIAALVGVLFNRDSSAKVGERESGE